MQQYQTWKITHLEEQIKALEGQVGILETQNDSIRGRLADTLRTAEATKDELEKLRQDSHLLHEALLSERGLHNDLKEKHETLVGRIRDVMSEVSEATE